MMILYLYHSDRGHRNFPSGWGLSKRQELDWNYQRGGVGDSNHKTFCVVGWVGLWIFSRTISHRICKIKQINDTMGIFVVNQFYDYSRN